MNRFAKNLKERLLNNAILLKPFDMVEELKMAQLQLIKRNQKPFDSIKLKTICKDLNVICDENVLFRCEGRLKNCTSPYDALRYQAKAPYFINSEHYLATLTLKNIHTRFKHISIKQTLKKLRQIFWICRGRQFVRNIFQKRVICKSTKDLLINTQFHLRYPNYE